MSNLPFTAAANDVLGLTNHGVKEFVRVGDAEDDVENKLAVHATHDGVAQPSIKTTNEDSTGGRDEVVRVSAENAERIKAIETKLEKLTIASVLFNEEESNNGREESLMTSIARLKDVTDIISSLKDSFGAKGDIDLFSLLPKEFHNQIPSIYSLLSTTSTTLTTITNSIEHITGVEESPMKNMLTSTPHEEDPVLTNYQVQSAVGGDAHSVTSTNLKRRTRDLLFDNKETKIKKTTTTSKAEYELRARGYHGFLAEDKKIDHLLHAPGGHGADIYESFSFEGLFGSNSFSAAHDSFLNDFASNPFNPSSFGGRRLNDDGVCAVPSEQGLKADRCARLIDCASKYTEYGK